MWCSVFKEFLEGIVKIVFVFVCLFVCGAGHGALFKLRGGADFIPPLFQAVPDLPLPGPWARIKFRAPVSLGRFSTWGEFE